MDDLGSKRNLDADHLDKGMQLAFGLASLKEGESVLDAIERVTGTRSRVDLHDPGDKGGPVVRMPSDDEADALFQDARYQVMGEIARGGVGVVYRGRDLDLGRDVAIKVLRGDRTGSPEVVQRFIEEAQIEGQLQHPGIVPVYGLGVQPDGRPYFAMKLVKGDTLAALLKKCNKVGTGRRRLLTAFEQVCQTLAYAHARRVVHRDLKPANILIGGFGEVQVVDWGFAKVLSRGGLADEASAARDEGPVTSLIETVRTGDESSQSVAGSVLGTPAYMPPEQACGHVRKVDETSDVFSLGAILTEILTGKAPYEGATTGDVLRSAREADTDAAIERLDACGADPSLLDLAKRCLAPAQDARPHDAGEVAEGVHAYLVSVEDRAHQADIRAAEARVKADGERRARRLTLGLAAAVLVAVVGGAGTLWYQERAEQQRVEKASQTVAGALQEVSLALGEARQAAPKDLEPWAAVVLEAEHALTLAEKVEAPPEVLERARALHARTQQEQAAAKQRATDLLREEAFLRGLREVSQIAWEPHVLIVDERSVEDDEARFAAAFHAGGIDLEDLEGSAATIRASVHRDVILAALDNWRRYRQLPELDPNPLVDLLAAADPDVLRTKIRKAQHADDPKSLRALLPKAGFDELPASTLSVLVWALASAEEWAASLRAARAWQAREPSSHDANFALGLALSAQRPPQAVYFHEAIAALERAAEANRESLPDRVMLAQVQSRLRLYDAVIHTLREALTLDPENAWCRWMLANALHVRGGAYQQGQRFLAAYEAYKEAIDLWEGLGPESAGPQLALLYGQSAVVAQRLEMWWVSHAAAKKSVEMNPDAPHVVKETLAATQCRMGQWDEGLATLEAIEASGHRCQGLVGNKALALATLGRTEEALACFEAIRTETFEHALDKATSVNWMLWEARSLLHLDRIDEAAQRCNEALALDPASIMGHVRRARIHRRQGAPEAELQSMREAARQARLLAQEANAGSQNRSNRLQIWGSLLARVVGAREARAELRKAFPEAQPAEQACFLAGVAHAQQNLLLEPEAAEATIDEALALDPQCDEAWELRGWMRAYAGDVDGAFQAMRKAGEAKGGLHFVLPQLGTILMEAGRFEELRALGDDCEFCRRREENLKKYAETEAQIPAFEAGSWRPEPGAEDERLASLLGTHGRHDLVVTWTQRTLAEPMAEGTSERVRVLRDPVAQVRGLIAAATLAGDASLPVAERNRYRALAAEWLMGYARALPMVERIQNPYEADSRAAHFVSLWYAARLAPIRDEEAMREAPADVQQACREAWAAFRAYFESVR